jgi:hypothetical protein
MPAAIPLGLASAIGLIVEMARRAKPLIARFRNKGCEAFFIGLPELKSMFLSSRCFTPIQRNVCCEVSGGCRAGVSTSSRIGPCLLLSLELELVLEFGHFLVRVPIARRANREQPRASARLKPWDRHAQGNRPEGASESALYRTYKDTVILFNTPVHFPLDCTRGLLYEASAAVPAF